MTRLKCISAFFIAILMITVLGCVSTSAEEKTGQSVDGRDIMSKKKAGIVLSLIYQTGKSSGQCHPDSRIFHVMSASAQRASWVRRKIAVT